MAATYIRLENTFEKAMYYRNSPRMNIYNFNGVHLLPDVDNGYVQRTYASEGIELEDFDVFLCEVCGTVEIELTPGTVNVENFNDPDTGLPQVYWSFKPGATDLGMQLVYLKFKQGTDYVYSSPFYLTNDNAEYTTRFDYWNELNDTVLSTNLNIYYLQPDTAETISTYDFVYSDGGITNVSSSINFEVWQFGIVDIYLFGIFKEMRRYKYVYLNYNRVMPHKAFDTPRLEGRENFAEAEIELRIDYNDVYDPNYIPPPPPPDPPVPIYTINLVTVASLSNSFVSFSDFNTDIPEPDTFIYQTSLDEITWTNESGDAVPPTEISAPDNTTNNYFYRIWHVATDTYSNVLQLPNRSIVITDMLSRSGSVWKSGLPVTYAVQFSLFGFSIPPGGGISFEFSTNGTTWMNINPILVSGASGENNSESFNTPPSSVQFKFFRITYLPFGVVSNVYEFELPEI